jgi:hypothetical protein
LPSRPAEWTSKAFIGFSLPQKDFSDARAGKPALNYIILKGSKISCKSFVQAQRHLRKGIQKIEGAEGTRVYMIRLWPA